MVNLYDGLVQERRNSSALAMELRLFSTNPMICTYNIHAIYANQMYILIGKKKKKR